MTENNYTKNNAKIIVEWSSNFKKFLFTFPLNEDAISDLLKRASVSLAFVLIFYFLGWAELILFLLSFILLYIIEKRNMSNLFQNIPNLVCNNSTYSNQNSFLMSKNHDFYQKSSLLTSIGEISSKPADIEMVPYPYYKLIHSVTEIIELQNQITELEKRVKKLEEELEKKKEQQIISINFFETDKLKLKKSFNVVLEYDNDNEIYIVDCPEINVYGQGRDEKEAIEDFKIALEEYYFSLRNDESNLTADLKKELDYLNQIIEEKK